jgi:hypothetical protein
LTVTATEEIVQLVAPIFKVEQAEGEEALFVYGKATGPDLDLDHQIIDLEFAKRACDEWFKNWANVRQMHSTNLPPAGVAVEMDARDDGIYLKAKVVEPVAMRLVREGAYKAFSIGIASPRIVRDPIAKNGRVIDGRVVEFSLVDNPALPSAKFAVLKAVDDGSLTWIGKAYYRNEEGGWTEQIPAASGTPATTKADAVEEHAHTELLNHVHRHADGTEHSHPHQHAKGSADHDDSAHGHDVSKRDLGEAVEKLIEDKLSDILQRGQSGEAALVAKAESDDEEKGEPVGLTDAIKEQFVRDLKDESKNPTAHVSQALRRLNQWAASGNYPTGLDYEDVRWMAQQCVNELKRRNPDDSEASMEDFPGPKAARVALGKCQALSDALTAAAKDSKGRDTRKHQSAEALKVEWQAQIKPLHDALCAAYPWEALKAAYPELGKNGLAAALGPTTQSLIYQMLCNECDEDGGTGSESHDIKELACAYHALVCFLQDEASEAMVVMAAREELHKDFAAANGLPPGWSGGGAGSPPSPTDPLPPPSRFKRPFIQAGHYRQQASTTNPSKPSANRVPEPEDFHRGYLTEGHAADSPANKGIDPALEESLAKTLALALGLGEAEARAQIAELASKAQDPARPGPNRSARTYYTNAAKEQARNALQAIHDHLTRIFPDLCPMENPAGDDQPAEVKADSVPQPMSVLPSPPSPGEKTAQAELLKEAGHDIALLVKAAVAAELEQRVAKLREAHEAERQQDRAKIAELEAAVDRLGRRADTAEAPYRSAAPGPVIGVAKGQKAATPVDHYRQWLEQMLSAPDSQTAAYARQALEALARNASTPNP